MVDIIHRVGMKVSASSVYAAVATVEGVAAWWSRETTGTSKVGGSMKARFLTPGGEEIGTIGWKVTALDPDRKVQWRITEGPPEWIGTDVVFEVHREGDWTLLKFGHRNWREEVDFMGHCSTKWAVFLMSLKELVETGTGKPSPVDVKIDSWN
jgi:hypothetical protein